MTLSDSYLITPVFFILAGLFEIGGGYLVWLWLREGKPIWFGILGCVILCLYGGVVPTLPRQFRQGLCGLWWGVYRAFHPLVWGWKVDHVKPDSYDLIGGAIALVGVLIIMYWPRPS